MDMNVLLEIFEPYIPFISFLIFIIINTFLILNRIHWIGLIIVNVLITIVMNVLGLGEYDFITIVITNVINILKTVIVNLVSTLLEVIGDKLGSIWDWINPFN